MRDVLVVLFWIWLAVALGVYVYRIYRRVSQGPKSAREAGAAEGGLLDKLGQGSVPPLPEGPIEARLPQSLQNVPPPAAAGDVVVPAAGPAEGTMGTPPRHHDDPPPIGMPKLPTLGEALKGIEMPADLLPIIDPGEPGLVDGRRARFGATGTNVPTVAVALGEELQRLGYAVDGLGTIGSTRAGLTATRGDVSVAAVIEIDDDTGAVVVEMNV